MTATVAGIHLGLDTHANRPAGNTVPDGSHYSCSTHGIIYKSNLAGNSWATWASTPGFEFTYDEFTSPVSITATTEGSANTVKASSSVAYDGSTIVWIEFFCAYAQNPTGDNLIFVLLEDSTVLGIEIQTPEGLSNNQRVPGVTIRRRRTPSNASHTYTVKAYVGSGTGVVGVGAGGSGNYLPGYVRVIKA